jgi:hypothetical protein
MPATCWSPSQRLLRREAEEVSVRSRIATSSWACLTLLAYSYWLSLAEPGPGEHLSHRSRSDCPRQDLVEPLPRVNCPSSSL